MVERSLEEVAAIEEDDDAQFRLGKDWQQAPSNQRHFRSAVGKTLLHSPVKLDNFSSGYGIEHLFRQSWISVVGVDRTNISIATTIR